MTTCLMIIHLIRDYLQQHEEPQAESLIQSTNELIGTFRGAELPIIWVRQEFAPDLSDAFLEMRERGIRIAIAGTEGAQIDPRLDWTAIDITIVKKRYSAFFRTPLDEVLSQLGASELVLAGLNTHACIRTAAIDAYQRDFKVILAADCMSSYDQEHAAVSMRYMDGKIANAMSNREVQEHLGNG
jgi:nicotinamidase-related amidase